MPLPNIPMTRRGGARIRGDWQLAAGHFIPAKFAPAIVGPSAATEAGTDAAWSRYRRCPSGIAYRVPIAVTGGAWPFLYELTTAPSGMTVGAQYGDTDYGILSWSNPTVGTHSIAARVTDQDGTVVTRSWSLEVIDRENTTYFVFCDSVNGSDSTGDGSFSDPFATVLGWYGTTPGATTAFNSATFNGRQAFYRAGTYATNLITDPDGYPNRVRWYSSYKPVVHVGYPGEVASFDCDDYFIDTGTASDAAICGMSLINGNQAQAEGIKHSYWRTDAASRLLCFENTFGATSGTTAGGTNSACLMLTGGTASNVVVSHNTYDNPSGSDFLLNYGSTDILCEGNSIVDHVTQSESHGFYLKSNGAERVSIRNNSGNSTREFVEIDYNFQSGALNTWDNIEVCWNNVKVSDIAAIRMRGSNAGGTAYETYIFRNNLSGIADIDHSTSDVTQGSTPNVIYEKNILQGMDLTPGPVLDFTDDGTGTTTDCVGYLDATTNLLTGAARTSYLGTHGSEVA